MQSRLSGGNMSDVAHTSHVRIKGPVRIAHLPGEAQPVTFSHAEFPFAQHVGERAGPDAAARDVKNPLVGQAPATRPGVNVGAVHERRAQRFEDVEVFLLDGEEKRPARVEPRQTTIGVIEAAEPDRDGSGLSRRLSWHAGQFGRN